MPARLLSTREVIVWAVSFLAIATLLVTSGFASDDPDSALYAGLADRLAQEPVRRWLAPEWWGFWPEAGITGLFREHPAGVFLLPAALTLVGVPATQGAYVVGIAAGLATLLMMAWLIQRLTTRDDARMALVLLQLMPVAFIFRVRANHEYPMLVCLLLTLLGLASVSAGRSMWRGAALVAAGLTAGLFIKGVFVVLILLAAGVWMFVNPTGQPGARVRQAAACAIGLCVMTLGAVWYEAAYRAATSESFWPPYWQRQLGPVTIVTPLEGASTLVGHLAFYLSRLVWHPAPWSVAVLLALWRGRGRAREWITGSGDAASRGLFFVAAYVALFVLLMSPASRVAERYLFPATYAVAAAGVVIAWRQWPRVRAAVAGLDSRVPALPALLWLVLMLFRLAAGPYLPRLQFN